MSKIRFPIFAEMENKSNYKPINCSSYDYLELHAMRKTLLNISLSSKTNSEYKVQTRICDLRAIDGEEFMYLENGEKHRLDTLISITPVE